MGYIPGFLLALLISHPVLGGTGEELFGNEGFLQGLDALKEIQPLLNIVTNFMKEQASGSANILTPDNQSPDISDAASRETELRGGKFEHEEALTTSEKETNFAEALGKSHKRLKECQKVKEKREIPSADKNHSPITQFGYAHFDEESRMTILKPGVTLSYMFGFKQPVKIGSQDYIAGGDLIELVEFFKCFGDYELRASQLGSDGTWSEGEGGLYVQLQDTVPTNGAHDSVKALLFRRALDQIVKQIKPEFLMSPEVMAIVPEHLHEMTSDALQKGFQFNSFAQWMPSSLQGKAMEIWNKMCKASSMEERMDILVSFITNDEAHRKNKDWEGLKGVNLDGPLMVTLTSYPAPDHGNRATLRMPCNVCKMEAVGKELEKLLPKRQ